MALFNDHAETRAEAGCLFEQCAEGADVILLRPSGGRWPPAGSSLGGSGMKDPAGDEVFPVCVPCSAEQGVNDFRVLLGDSPNSVDSNNRETRKWPVNFLVSGNLRQRRVRARRTHHHPAPVLTTCPKHEQPQRPDPTRCPTEIFPQTDAHECPRRSCGPRSGNKGL